MSTAKIEIDEPIQGARPMIGAKVALTGRVTRTQGEGTDESVEIQIEQMAFQPQQSNMVGEVREQQAMRRGPAFGGGPPAGGPPPNMATAAAARPFA